MLRKWYYEYLEFGDLHKEHRKKPNKYSIEERKYAVDYYLEHGHILAETVRCLEYPHIETLRKWITEFYPNHHRETTNRINPKKFTDKEKQIAVIGGTSLSGGIGRIPGTLIGSLVLGVFQSGFTYLRFNAYIQEIIKGIIIIGAVVMDEIN